MNPCEESCNYNFQNCIYTKMISKVGCQPYWLDYINTDLAICSKASQLDLFLHHMQQLTEITTEKEIKEEYNCLKPCNYMEYKVRLKTFAFFPLLWSKFSLNKIFVYKR